MTTFTFGTLIPRAQRSEETKQVEEVLLRDGIGGRARVAGGKGPTPFTRGKGPTDQLLQIG